MAKRNKRKQRATEYEMTEVRGYGPEPYGPPVEAPAEPPANPPPLAHDRPPPNPTTLQGLREQALRTRKEATDHIASLESWRDEIDATIAFLKASKR